MKYVKVYQAKDEMDANLLLGYLESFGIKAVTQESSVNTPPFLSGDARSTVMNLVPRDIFVHEDKALEALELIKQVR